MGTEWGCEECALRVLVLLSEASSGAQRTDEAACLLAAIVSHYETYSMYRTLVQSVYMARSSLHNYKV
jgi:hypothetical protein